MGEVCNVNWFLLYLGFNLLNISKTVTTGSCFVWE